MEDSHTLCKPEFLGIATLCKLEALKTMWQSPPSPKGTINALISPEILEYMLTNRFTYLLVVLRTNLFLQRNNLVELLFSFLQK